MINNFYDNNGWHIIELKIDEFIYIKILNKLRNINNHKLIDGGKEEFADEKAIGQEAEAEQTSP